MIIYLEKKPHLLTSLNEQDEQQSIWWYTPKYFNCCRHNVGFLQQQIPVNVR